MKKTLLASLSLSALGAVPLAARAADEHTFAFNAYASPENGKNLGETALVVGAKYSF